MSVADVLSGFQDFYGLEQQPFSLAPNTDFYVETQSHQECFNVLMYALASGEGFIKVTGEVGTGKTLLSRRLLNELDDEHFVSAYIPNPSLTPTALWRAIAHELSIDVNHIDDHQVQEKIQKKLLLLASNHKKVVLIIDEAQCIPEDTLEALRLISNLETERQTLLQIVLFGQPELDVLLATQRFRQLRQRITYSAVLEPLAPANLPHYIQQRMMIAGYRGMPVFEDKAVKLMTQATSGIPRLINVIAQKSLLCAFGKGSEQVAVEHVKEAISDTEGTRSFIRSSSSGIFSYWREGLLFLILVVLVAMYEFS